jgi:hypothetical protein
MDKIVPSTKLKVVSVSKLKTMSCLRKYFWRYVCNLGSKYLNNAFWYGGVFGAGIEALMMGKSDKQVRAAMKAEDKRRVKGKVVKEDMLEEMALQRRLIEVLVFGAKDQPEFQKMHMERDQIKFKVKLRSGVLFCGTEDGEGTYAGKPCMFENKTATSVSDSYLAALTYGTQVNGYTWAQKKDKKDFPSLCVACVFQKCGKIVKKDQTVDDFLEEIRTDIYGGEKEMKTMVKVVDPETGEEVIDSESGKVKKVPKVKVIDPQPERYYRWHKFRLGVRTVSEVGEDIERQAEILKMLYADCGDDLLNPMLWPKQENKCADYKGCEFIQLCMNPARWKMYAERFFVQREMLYDEEYEEFAK